MNEVDILAPEFPESVSNAQIISWHRNIGEHVKRDDILLDIETDKVILEVPALIDGILTAIIIKAGEIIFSKQILGKITLQKEENLKKIVVEKKKSLINKTELEASPSVRKLIKQHSIDHTLIVATGKKGRLNRDDVLNIIKKDKVENSLNYIKEKEKNVENQQNYKERKVERIKISPLRMKMSERLLFSQRNMVTSTTFNEVNMKSILSLRKKYKHKFEEKHKIKLGLTSFFVKAVSESLKLFPEINSSIDRDDIIYYKYIDISVAIATKRGLITPVLKNVEEMSIVDIEKKIKDFILKGNIGKLSIDDLTGGNFTISNGGIFGSLMSIPIINPPQTAILGMHNIIKRVMVVKDSIVILPMMYMSLSYDHRIIDGKTSIQFLSRLKEILEDFSRILLHV
ncbi:dihydrolipoyllysine-residue succinyltransferase [Buchnera aphidicola]|uniref:Dihydrolipoyllysine-residue succinyltransferase component of 2-oxoglutarate dehydrogenase complex n=1 Tax=Buchnera aphidicola (Anoecia oenotherae) TaxID=1241833 RepID=A0A4D6XPW1_9GAMM|nr:dihydrolipoyllysine-residue succinyltransferase [Buchnera aphidicola]QCI19362.1 dihydrolipoyllysine-residue succinyltransferase [Buchnera aphidicola (Anoecia oenotherae)]